MNRVFVTGVSGFLGSHVAVELVRRGHQVVGLTRGTRGASLLRDVPIEYCEGTLAEPERYAPAMRTCNAVIHTAALSSFGEKDPAEYVRTNYEGTKLLLENAKKAGIVRFVHISTRGVFGVAPDPAQSDETCPTVTSEDRDDYIRFKLKAHDEVVRMSASDGMACLMLCPTALIGAHDDRPTPIGRIIRAFLQGRAHVYIDGGINIIDVEDAAGACVTALTQGRNGEAYLLGGANITLQELFQELSALSGRWFANVRIPLDLAYAGAFLLERVSRFTGQAPFATRARVTALSRNYSYCRSTKAVSELGLAPTPVAVTLEKMIRWARSAGYCA